MKHLLIIILLLAGYAGVAEAFGTGELGCSGDCTSCHKITIQDAQAALDKIAPSMTVESVSRAPVPGLYQMIITKGKDKGISYLDYSKRYIIKGPVFDLGKKEDITSKSMLELMESGVVDTAKIRLDNALLMGNPKGTKHLYLFTDPDCPYCARAHEVVQQLVKKMPDLAVHILIFPLKIHSDAAWQTNAIIAASKSDMAGALKMLEDCYEKKEIKKNPKAKDYATELEKMGQELGIVSTPTLVYANGKIGLGVKTLEEMSAGVSKNVKK